MVFVEVEEDGVSAFGDLRLHLDVKVELKILQPGDNVIKLLSRKVVPFPR